MSTFDRFNDYNKISRYSMLSYNIISRLMLENENIWKILYYNTPDALSMPNLSQEQKASLIYNGEDDSEPFRVFRSEFPTDDLFEDRVSQLRIYPSLAEPTERTYATVSTTFQFVTHVKINHLDNYSTRVDMITEELISTLNGLDVGYMSPMYWDDSSGRSTVIRVSKIGNNKNYTGVLIVMDCKVGA